MAEERSLRDTRIVSNIFLETLRNNIPIFRYIEYLAQEEEKEVGEK